MSALTFSENYKLFSAYSSALREYDKALSNQDDFATISVLRSDAKEIMTQVSDIERKVKRNFGRSLRNSAKRIVRKIKGEDYEL